MPGSSIFPPNSTLNPFFLRRWYIILQVVDFPFKNNWYELTLKRLIRYAADNRFDAISIPKASVVQDRYQLTRRIDDFDIGSFELIDPLGSFIDDILLCFIYGFSC